MNSNDFEYKYTAPTIEERKEIESIRNSYLPQKTTKVKLEELKKLDNKVKSIPQIISLICGVVGTLIFGLGLAMILEWQLIVWGVIVATIGVFPIGMAYPIFVKQTNKLKDKYAGQIIELSDELLNDKNAK